MGNQREQPCVWGSSSFLSSLWHLPHRFLQEMLVCHRLPNHTCPTSSASNSSNTSSASSASNSSSASNPSSATNTSSSTNPSRRSSGRYDQGSPRLGFGRRFHVPEA